MGYPNGFAEQPADGRPRPANCLWRHLRARGYNMKSLMQRSWLKPKMRRLRLDEFTQEILRLIRGTIAPSTYALYAFSLRALVRVVGNLHVATLTPYHMDHFISRRLEEVSAVRVNIELRSLRALFNRATMYGMVQSCPLTGVRQVRVLYQNPRSLSQRELDRLLSSIHDAGFHSLVVLAVCTAMRAGELALLRWADVDLCRGLIHLTNREGFRLKGLRARDIPLSARAVQVLKLLPRRSERVFVRQRGTPYTAHALSVRFKEYARLARLPEEIHLHSLRHTAASIMVQRNVPLPYIRDILGHTSITTTMIYAHTAVDHLRRSVRTIDPLAIH